jgi:hypothetical protein
LIGSFSTLYNLEVSFPFCESIWSLTGRVLSSMIILIYWHYIYFINIYIYKITERMHF